ncbi:MAG: NERD domain-containing protein [Candidatus Avispirillum sp.]
MAVLIVLVVFIKEYIEYKSGTYYSATKLPYIEMRSDFGRYGEYLIYKRLRKFEKSGAKFLFNVYVPKDRGETSEIDALMICTEGIFVFESKNYSGWIFGSEDQGYWYQTLPTGKKRSHKERFYNPIMQNRSHIKALLAFLGEHVPVHSVIVFSERCTLKSVNVKSENISVVKRCDIVQTVADICGKASETELSEKEIADIYGKLYPLTQAGDDVKAKHIDDIYINLNSPKSGKQDVSVQPAPSADEFTYGDNTPLPSTDMNLTDEKTENVKEPKSEHIDAEKEKNTVTQTVKCPRCGGALVLRTAGRGKNAGNKFYGCSNYPKCKFIQNINEQAK